MSQNKKKISFNNKINVRYYNLDEFEKSQKKTSWLLIKIQLEELEISHFCYGKKKINGKLMV